MAPHDTIQHIVSREVEMAAQELALAVRIETLAVIGEVFEKNSTPAYRDYVKNAALRLIAAAALAGKEGV